MKLRSFVLAAAMMAAPAAAFADDLYAMFPENCAIGVGGEGNVSIGNGYFSATETHYERASPRVDVGGGFKAASYNIMSEGEAYGQERISMRITPDAVAITYQDGRKFSARRCR